MPICRNICFPLRPLSWRSVSWLCGLLLTAVLVTPGTGRAAPDQPPCISEQDACVPATPTLRYAGKVAAAGGGSENVFGFSVEIQGDLLAVGAPWDSEKGYRAGAVYLFRATGKGWEQLAKLTPRNPVAKAMFGSSLDLGDQRLIIGAPGERDGKMISAGAVYVFEYGDRKVWQQKSRLVSDDLLAGDFFGASVVSMGDSIAIGAHLEDGKGIDSGAVYIFARTATGQWQQRQKLQPDTLKAGTLFGNALATDGRHLVVGAYGYDGTSPGGGAVYVYRTAANGTYQFRQMLQPDRRKAFAEFGWAIAIADGRLLIGAPYEDESERQAGAAYLFELDTTQDQWSLRQKLRYRDPKWQERFGASVALAGDRAVVGAPFGVAYLFAPSPAGQNAMTNAVTKNPVKGPAHTATPWQQAAKLVGNYPAADNLFSRTIASDGTRIVLGVPVENSENNRTGGVYVFQITPPEPPVAGE